jgi:hypothetical protein
VTRRNTRIHFIQPLKERIVREVGYGLSLEGASSAVLVKSKQAECSETQVYLKRKPKEEFMTRSIAFSGASQGTA